MTAGVLEFMQLQRGLVAIKLGLLHYVVTRWQPGPQV